MGFGFSLEAWEERDGSSLCFLQAWQSRPQDGCQGCEVRGQASARVWFGARRESRRTVDEQLASCHYGTLRLLLLEKRWDMAQWRSGESSFAIKRGAVDGDADDDDGLLGWLAPVGQEQREESERVGWRTRVYERAERERQSSTRSARRQLRDWRACVSWWPLRADSRLSCSPSLSLLSLSP